MGSHPITPELVLYIVVGALLPTLVWLWFWLKEDNVNPEPRGLLFLTFILGALGVVFVIPLQKFILQVVPDSGVFGIISAAGVEEIIKFLAVGVLAIPGKVMDQPVDFPIYFITAAMGFAALENSLFLVDPNLSGEFTVGLLAGQLRFLGSTLLHSTASATIGISIGLAFYKTKFVRHLYTIVGVFAAIALHSAFNFFIIERGGNDILAIYSFLWIATVFVLLVFEKLRRMGTEII